MAEESVELTGKDPVTDNDLDLRDRADWETTDAPPETEAIRARIEETRKGMGETIDAIQERLSIANISEQVSETVSNAIETAKDTAYDATIGKAVNVMKNVGDGISGSDAFRTVRSNPLPFALIGVGAGLLAYQKFSKRGSMYGKGQRQLMASRDDRTSAGGPYAGSRGLVSRTYDDISNRAEHAVENVSEKANAAYDKVSSGLSTAYGGANDIAHRAYDRLGDFGERAHEKYDEYIEQNPLAVGAVAMAVGAAVGFALPSTRPEGRLMGGARDNLIQRAQDAAGHAIERAKQATAEAGKTISDEARTLPR